MADAPAELVAALEAAVVILGAEPEGKVALERPARPEHGDWSSNVAMVFGRSLSRKPRELAEAIAEIVRESPPSHVLRVEVAGPGFVNFFLDKAVLHEVLSEVIAAGPERFGRNSLLAGRNINVEFVSANPTGPLHAGHGRWAAYGDSLCRLLEWCGAKTHREYYLNDRGLQMRLFAESLQARQSGSAMPEGGYHAEYIQKWADEMPADADPAAWGYARARQHIQTTLERINVVFDSWSSEAELVESGAVEVTLGELRARGATYEADGATWLRTTDFGDEKDRVLIKSDGEATYLLPDVAYHRDKLSRGFDTLIDVWGADHHGYVGRMKAALAALGYDPERLEIILGQLVNLRRSGQEIRLSKRAGQMIELSDLVDAVGADVARFVFLLQSIDTAQTIDIDVVTSASSENPVYYIQYAYARIAALSREARRRSVSRADLADVDLSALVTQRELDLLRKLSDFPGTVSIAGASRAPHRIATWTRELAGAFHGFYHDCPVLRSDVDPNLTQARLWLVEATRVALTVGLSLLGISRPEQM